MYLPPPHPGTARPVPHDSRIVVPTPEGPRHIGHAHFWERALSRRQLIRTAAGTTVAVLGAGLLPAVASAAHHDDDDAPNPIPGGDPGIEQAFGKLFHVYFPYFGQEVATITDFNGRLAAAEMQGAGTGTDTTSGTTTRYTFDADMRFMDGVYVAQDGHVHRGTFGFV
ncbi:MAG TPA: hypothetical protein VFL91_16455 [Thermomicrobiales bacterium]|nr:hypothetical protein [Thermomicrobiales bacterium]